MKAALIAVVPALAACVHVEKVHDDIVRVRDLSGIALEGHYRYPDVFWRTTIDLRADHTFRYEQMTDTFERTVIDGTWSRDGDRLKTEAPAPHDGTVYYLVVRRGKRVGLLAEASLAQLRKDDALRHVHAQTCWREEKPNKALEPTPTSVTLPADAGVAPAAVVAHL